ncbi:MAG TPA: LysE family translocator [Burkholderiaceae bacterium]|nr:LysE family translocator [Burkholderiaceae bacterium]
MDSWGLYLVAAIGLSLTPGPNSLLALTHGALHGSRRTLFTVAGGALGFVLLIGLSMLGIGALLAASAGALAVLKVAGGAYLVWLGVQLWRAPPIRLEPGADAGEAAHALVLFRQGFLTAASNPKGLLFYGAFLPQFIDGTKPLLPQFLGLAATFVGVEIVFEALLAALAHRIRPWLQRAGRGFNRGCGGMFIGIGAALPLTR